MRLVARRRVIASGRKAAGLALALTTWTREIVVCTNGKPADMDTELMGKLDALNIPILEPKLKCVRSRDGEAKSIDFENGMSLNCDQIFFAIG